MMRNGIPRGLRKRQRLGLKVALIRTGKCVRFLTRFFGRKTAGKPADKRVKPNCWASPFCPPVWRPFSGREKRPTVGGVSPARRSLLLHPVVVWAVVRLTTASRLHSSGGCKKTSPRIKYPCQYLGHCNVCTPGAETHP